MEQQKKWRGEELRSGNDSLLFLLDATATQTVELPQTSNEPSSRVD